MKEILKKLLVTLLIISNIVLGVLYVRVQTQYEMYQKFTENGYQLKSVPTELPSVD